MRKCKLKECKNIATTKPYEKGLYCSSKCALAAVRTRKHQSEAAKKSGESRRGLGVKGYVKFHGRHEHRIVMEKVLGRKLKKGEVVHHIDRNKKNNDPSNLQLFASQREHIKAHLKDGNGKII
jgi:hypothetical protein